MIKVTFIEHDGTETTAEGDHGDSVMSLAVAQGRRWHRRGMRRRDDVRDVPLLCR